jgi:hypothetical protein
MALTLSFCLKRCESHLHLIPTHCIAAQHHTVSQACTHPSAIKSNSGCHHTWSQSRAGHAAVAPR